jgi:hypothetical protein
MRPVALGAWKVEGRPQMDPRRRFRQTCCRRAKWTRTFSGEKRSSLCRAAPSLPHAARRWGSSRNRRQPIVSTTTSRSRTRARGRGRRPGCRLTRPRSRKLRRLRGPGREGRLSGPQREEQEKPGARQGQSSRATEGFRVFDISDPSRVADHLATPRGRAKSATTTRHTCDGDEIDRKPGGRTTP